MTRPTNLFQLFTPHITRQGNLVRYYTHGNVVRFLWEGHRGARPSIIEVWHG